MTVEELKDLFQKHDEEFLKNSDQVHGRLDLKAFNLINELVPGRSDIIGGASHDKIYLGVEVEDLTAAGILEEQVIELIRCGVILDSDNYLIMFV